VFTGVGPNGNESLFQISFELKSMPSEHKHVNRNAIGIAERGMRETVFADVPQLDFADGQFPMALPELREFFRGEEELYMPAKIAR